jgi:hypothetical protein
MMVVEEQLLVRYKKSKLDLRKWDTIEVLEIFAIKELYSFQVCRGKSKMADYPNVEPRNSTVSRYH